jgi:AmiR/NasT family two-component response regulator
MEPITAADPPCGTPACKELVANLAAMADHRDLIGMAKGILMATTGCGPDEAFERLKVESSHRNMKLWQVAETYVSEASGRASR